MSLTAWAAAVAQADPDPITVRGGDRPLVYLALTGAILVLTSVIAVLWRRGERRNDRALKAAEDAREREVARADLFATRLAEERAAFAELLAAERTASAQIIEKQRADLTGVADRERAAHDAALRAIVEQQIAADAKLTEGLAQLARVVEATKSRIPRAR